MLNFFVSLTKKIVINVLRLLLFVIYLYLFAKSFEMMEQQDASANKNDHTQCVWLLSPVAQREITRADFLFAFFLHILMTTDQPPFIGPHIIW